MTNAPSRRMRRSVTAVVVLLVATWLSPAVQVSAETVVLVQAGDSLSSLAFDHGVTVSALMAANGLADPDLVYMGQELRIPAGGVFRPRRQYHLSSPSNTARACRSSRPDTA